MINIVIDGLKLPIEMIAGFTQDYQIQHNSTTHRSINGTPWRQTTWKKINTTVSGSSWIPSLITNLSFDVAHELRCAIPVSKIIQPNAATVNGEVVGAYIAQSELPSLRDDDQFNRPYYFAVVNGETINAVGYLDFDASILSGAQLYVIEPVAGAEYYVMTYQPVIQVLIDPPRVSLDSNGAAYAWSLTAVEV